MGNGNPQRKIRLQMFKLKIKRADIRQTKEEISQKYKQLTGEPIYRKPVDDYIDLTDFKSPIERNKEIEPKQDDKKEIRSPEEHRESENILEEAEIESEEEIEVDEVPEGEEEVKEGPENKLEEEVFEEEEEKEEEEEEEELKEDEEIIDNLTAQNEVHPPIVYNKSEEEDNNENNNQEEEVEESKSEVKFPEKEPKVRINNQPKERKGIVNMNIEESNPKPKKVKNQNNPYFFIYDE